MKNYIFCLLMMLCIASPRLARADIELRLDVVTVDADTRDVNLYAKSTTSDLTNIDAIQWSIAYQSTESLAFTALGFDFASDWGPGISIVTVTIGSYNRLIFWQGADDISNLKNKTISSTGLGTLMATIQFDRVGSSWGNIHIVTELESAIYGTIITNASEQQVILYPSEDQSLPVQMTEMKATADTKEGIVLMWTTESEVNSAGFYVWRSESETGKYQRLPGVMISGQGNSSSKTGYRFSDPNARTGKTYWYKIEAVSTDGRSEFHGPISVSSQELIPHEFALTQNFPNPFNPVTEASYDLPEASNVLIRVFSMLGKEVKTLVDQTKQAGRYSVHWDGTDDKGLLAPSGIYFLQMQAGSFSYVRKMTFIR